MQKDCGLALDNNVEALVEHVKNRAKRVESALPEPEDFEQDIVSDGGVLLALLIHLGHHEGRSFPSEKILRTANEPLEVQHLFPRAVLDSFDGHDNRFIPDRLGNLTILARSDNEHLGDSEPRSYLEQVDDQTRQVHLIPDDPKLWVVDRYPDFCQERERMMARAVNDLLNELLKGSQ